MGISNQQHSKQEKAIYFLAHHWLGLQAMDIDLMDLCLLALWHGTLWHSLLATLALAMISCLHQSSLGMSSVCLLPEMASVVTLSLASLEFGTVALATLELSTVASLIVIPNLYLKMMQGVLSHVVGVLSLLMPASVAHGVQHQEPLDSCPNPM